MKISSVAPPEETNYWEIDLDKSKEGPGGIQTHTNTRSWGQAHYRYATTTTQPS